MVGSLGMVIFTIFSEQVPYEYTSEEDIQVIINNIQKDVLLTLKPIMTDALIPDYLQIVSVTIFIC